MNKSNMIWFGRYEGWLRMLAHGVKDGDVACIDKAAKLFDLMLPDRCIIVPMPCHLGAARYMLEVADRMPGRRFVMDALTCEPHESCYDQKKDGYAPSDFNMSFNTTKLFDTSKMGMVPKEDFNGGIYIIDNVICTGVTASAARRAVAMHGLASVVCAIAYSPWR